MFYGYTELALGVMGERGRGEGLLARREKFRVGVDTLIALLSVTGPCTTHLAYHKYTRPIAAAS